MPRRVMEVTLTKNKAKMSGFSGASSDVNPTISEKFVLKIKRLVDVIAPVFNPIYGYLMPSLGLRFVQVGVKNPPARPAFRPY